MAYLKTIIALLLSIVQILTPIGASFIKGGEDKFFERWTVRSGYTEDYAIELEKKPNKDFVILSIADIQLEKWEAYAEKGKNTTRLINQLVSSIHPDLITVLGDNAWSTSTYLKMIKDLDSLGIPWAPVMGNHDGSCCISEFWCAYEMYDAKNCLFKFGPENMGYGNYIINITENGKIIHTLFMMDTHSGGDDEGNCPTEYAYAGLWDNQIEWYKWAVNGIENIAGKTVESTAFFHIPTPEFAIAWNEAYDNSKGVFKGEYADTSFGYNEEPVCACGTSAFFNACKELGSTKNIICGHDHVNNSSILYDGIRLTYSMKCGEGGYWNPERSGGTVLTINSEGNLSVPQHIIIK